MKSHLENILKKVAAGQLSPEEALKGLKHYPYQDLDFAKIDFHRENLNICPASGIGGTEGFQD